GHGLGRAASRPLRGASHRRRHRRGADRRRPAPLCSRHASHRISSRGRGAPAVRGRAFRSRGLDVRCHVRGRSRPRRSRARARVCRLGGRVALATWTPDGAIARFFALLASHGHAPAPSASPLLWGDPEYVERLLGREFSLRFEHGISNAYYDSADEPWDAFVHGFGPVRVLHERLDEAGRRRLKADVDAYHEQYRTPAGLHIRREYLITVGERR